MKQAFLHVVIQAAGLYGVLCGTVAIGYAYRNNVELLLSVAAIGGGGVISCRPTEIIDAHARNSCGDGFDSRGQGRVQVGEFVGHSALLGCGRAEVGERHHAADGNTSGRHGGSEHVGVGVDWAEAMGVGFCQGA